ncbi:hypothetical protein HDU67_008655 [Dinochytrium kinnereticum]|nr:hypothetical protein HDU67_008655 [Dinochytrium kinnereticum]
MATEFTPPCGFFNSSNLDGYSIEFSMLQSKTCIPNKLILGVTIGNLSYTSLTLFAVIFAFLRDFMLVSKSWTDSKSVFVLCFGAASGVLLMTIADITGSHAVNSMGWMLATLFICTMEHLTITSWAKVTINLVSITSKDLQKQYENLKFRMLILSCIVLVILIPVFSIRIALYNYHDPLVYNITFMASCLMMIPWFMTFTYTVYSFGSMLATILEDSVKELSNIGGPSSGGDSSQSSNNHSSVGNQSSSNAATGSNIAASKAEKKKAETLAIAFKVRLVGYGLIVDKLGFIGSYSAICTYGFITLRNTGMGTLAYLSYYGHNFVVIPWATALIWICLPQEIYLMYPVNPHKRSDSPLKIISNMEHLTITSWAKITINLVSITSKDLQKQYENLKFRMLVLSCVVLGFVIPIFSVRIALYNYHDPLAYNVTFMVYCILMTPWFATFTYTVYSFGNMLATILEDSVKELSSIAGPSSTASESINSANNASNPPTSSMNNATNASSLAANRAEKKKADTLAIAFKVRLVGYGLMVDKAGFIGSFILICTYGFITLRNTGLGTLAYLSYYGHNFIVIPWATALIWICLLYNWKSAGTKPEPGNSSKGSNPAKSEI